MNRSGWTPVVIALIALLFLELGFFLGKQSKIVQVGRYRQFGMGALIIDTSTGQICDSYGYPADTIPKTAPIYPPCKYNVFNYATKPGIF